MKASLLSFQAAVLFVLVGMGWGIQMAISHNHAGFPAHAHLNLLGWVSLFLFGLFYHLHPELDRTRMALLQVWVWIAGTAMLALGVGLIYYVGEEFEPVAAVGAITVFVSMLAFAWQVFRSEGSEAAQKPAFTPAK